MSEGSGGHRTDAPALARYARARRAGPLLFLAGVSARRPDNSVPGAARGATGATEIDIRAQTEGCIENLRRALAEEDLALGDLVDVTVFLVHMADYGGFVEAWNRHFDATGPTRTTVAVHQLPDPQLAIEMKAIARVGDRAPRPEGGGLRRDRSQEGAAAAKSFAELEREAPDLAEAARRLLVGGDGVAIGFLATAGADGTPHLAPVCPIFCGEELYVCAVARSPKAADLRASGRYVLHAFLGRDDEELQLAGRAREVADEAERAAVHAAIPFGSFDRSDPIFRLGLERALRVHWERPGEPGARAVRRRWRAG